MKKLIWILSALISLLFCYHPSLAQQGQPQLKKIIIIRHGEKSNEGDNLSCQGFNRALQLANVLNKKFGKTDYIFVPTINTGKKTSTARMYQTIVPYAIKYDLGINTKYDVDDTKGLAQDVLKRNGTVLVVWEHKHIDNILKAFGIDNKEKWPDEDFDSIWIINFQNGKPVIAKDKEGISPAADCK